jgi:hypothetical protein
MQDAKDDIFAKPILTPYYVRVSKTYLRVKQNCVYIFFHVQQYKTEDFAAHVSELAAHTLRTTAVQIRGLG